MKKSLFILLAFELLLMLLLPLCFAGDADRDREGFVNEYELIHIIADSDFACGLPNCKIRENHLFEVGTLTKKEIKLLKKRYPKDNWHFEFNRDIRRCRGCGLIEVSCSGYDYYKAVPKGTTKDGVMSMWFFDFEDNYLLKRIWELEQRIKKLEEKDEEKPKVDFEHPTDLIFMDEYNPR